MCSRRDIFFPAPYIGCVANAIISVLSDYHAGSTKPENYEFLALLVGRLGRRQQYSLYFVVFCVVYCYVSYFDRVLPYSTDTEYSFLYSSIGTTKTGWYALTLSLRQDYFGRCCCPVWSCWPLKTPSGNRL